MAVQNNVGAAPVSRFRGSMFAAFDRLPLPVRQALQDAILDWDARWIRWELNKLLKAGVSERSAVSRMVAFLQAADDQEVKAFQHHWPARFGLYPHVAAGASILRREITAPSHT